MASTFRRGNSPFSQKDSQAMRPRDIDYAATAVQTAILEKFARQNDLEDLRVTAGEKTIRLEHQGRMAEGTRDNLLAAVRNAQDYAALWQELLASERFAN